MAQRGSGLVSGLVAGWLVASIAGAAWGQCVVPTNGMVLTQNTTLCGGLYNLPSGITIGASHITVTGTSTILQNTTTGYAVAASGRSHVTIRNLVIRGYKHGLHLSDCDDLTIEDCTVQGTYQDTSGFLNIFDGPTGSYGYAIWLRYCDRAAVRRCQVGSQQNGIGLFDCTYALVEHNQASNNNGWGIALYNVDNATIQFNTANDCTRIGSWGNGGDAAALLIVYGSDNNQILDNTLLRGGDGVFLAGATHSLQRRPNNNNYFARNDCSGSPNNGFEGTFSQGNVFEDNVSDHCNYGYWLGYSSTNTVRHNQANACTTAGIAIEHGYSNTIEGNTLRDNADAIWLWTDDDASLVAAYPECKDSHGYTIRNNTLTGNARGMRCEAVDANRLSYDYTIYGNHCDDNAYGIHFIKTTDSLVHANWIRTSSVCGMRLDASTGNTIYDNYFQNALNASATLANTWNIAKTAGTNILGKPFLGGNYWSDYAGVDTNGDALGDTRLPHTSSGGIAVGGDSLPLLPVIDTDQDGLADEWEQRYFFNLALGAGDDPDEDGLTNLAEYIAGTNPTWRDTDADGLDDGVEVHTTHTDPTQADSDDDGLNDGAELQRGTNPLNPDSDGDGMPDGWEVTHNLDPCADDAGGDPDTDGLANGQEYVHATDPHNADSDGDGVADGEEVADHSDPCSAYSFAVPWVTLASDPAYFPYVDVETPPTPDYWPRSSISVVAANGHVYSAGGYGPRLYMDTNNNAYEINRQAGFSIYDLAAGTWQSARWDGTGPTGYNNSCGAAGPTRGQGAYTGNSQCFGYDRDGDGTEEVFVLAGYPIWDGWFAVYDPDTDTWSHTAGRTGGLLAAYFATALEYAGRAYVYGGQYNGPDGNGFYVYDIASDTWTQRANGPVRMKQHCGEVVDGVMYLIGGQQDTVDFAARVIAYDVTAGTWDPTTRAAIPVGVNRAASCVHAGKIYVVGGLVPESGSTDRIQVYDPVANAWTSGFPLPAPRSAHGAVVVGDMLYVLGGRGPGADGEENKADLWAVDLTLPHRPRVQVMTPAGAQGALVPLSYRLWDIDGDTCSVAVEYSVNGGASWHAATAGPGGDGVSELASALTGTAHTFLWNAGADLGVAGAASVRVRVTPADTAAGTSGQTSDFAVVVGGLCSGDGNCDGVVNWRDIDYLIAGQNDNESAWRELFGAGGPECPFTNLDVNEDAQVNWRDIDPFIARMNVTCGS